MVPELAGWPNSCGIGGLVDSYRYLTNGPKQQFSIANSGLGIITDDLMMEYVVYPYSSQLTGAYTRLWNDN